MLVEVKTEVQPDPKTLHWNTFEQAVNTIPGGRICIGKDLFVDSEGNPLDAESQLNEIDTEIAKLEARKKALEAQKSDIKAEPVKEDVKVEDKKITPPVK